MEGKRSIFVGVKESNELVEFTLADGEIVVVLEEREQFETVDSTTCIAINSLERRVGSKISDLTESLTKAFELSFAVADCDEQTFQSVF